MRRILSLLLVISILTITVFAGTYEPETYAETKQEPVQVEVSVKPEAVIVKVDSNNSIYFLAGFLSGMFVLGISTYYFMYIKPKFTSKKQTRKILNEKL